MTGDDSTKAIDFPKAETPLAELARRLQVEAERLAGLLSLEWPLYVPDIAKKYGVPQNVLRKMVETIIKEREQKAKQEKDQQKKAEQRAENQRSTAEREEKQKQKEA